MDKNQLTREFRQIGARAKLRREMPARRLATRSNDRFSIDVASDKKGEFFDINIMDDALDFHVLDIQPRDRHLLLFVRGRAVDSTRPFQERLLCGHDERHWFVAGVTAGSRVDEAKESLKPDEAKLSQQRNRVKPKNRHRRRNTGYVRQGEWFFVPTPRTVPDDWLVLRNEPIQRARGKPHTVEFIYRRGGTTVHVCRKYPYGLTKSEFKKLLRERPEEKNMPWRTMSRNPEVFAKGRVRHPDHKTITLSGWHRVVGNREIGSTSVAFLD